MGNKIFGKLNIQVSKASLQGVRPTHEDAIAILGESEIKEHPCSSVFCLFDGHNGDRCAKYMAENFPRAISLKLNDKGVIYPDALTQIYIEFDDEFIRKCNVMGGKSGCTAVTAILNTERDRLVVGNVGDSHLVLSSNGKARVITTEHSPTRPQERRRIETNGVKITDGRLDGVLSLSRALGNPDLKKLSLQSTNHEDRALSAVPDVVKVYLTPKDEFFIIACDGVWDVMSSQDAVDFVRKELKGFAKNKFRALFKGLADDLCQHAIRSGSRDNVSAVIVLLNHQEKETA